MLALMAVPMERQAAAVHSGRGRTMAIDRLPWAKVLP
jgi:hypothetical protein